jgi:hypothetical protein
VAMFGGAQAEKRAMEYANRPEQNQNSVKPRKETK